MDWGWGWMVPRYCSAWCVGKVVIWLRDGELELCEWLPRCPGVK